MRKECSWTGRLILFVGIALLFTLLLTIGGYAKTITVDDDGGADNTKIQDAIDNSTDGDTIRVFEGTYYENVIINTSVRLVGNGSKQTTIDGRGKGSVVRITADYVNMSGFTVIGSGNHERDSGILVESEYNRIFQNDCQNNEQGISLSHAEYCKLENNSLHSNNDDGIDLRSSNNIIIDNNECYTNRWGIYLRNSRNIEIENNACYSNTYAIYISDSEKCSITNNDLSFNNWSAIIIADSSTCSIRYNNCSLNPKNGIHLMSSNYCTITNNTISENGVGIYLTLSSRNNSADLNRIYNNKDYGINNTNNRGWELEATNNWWGDLSGPYHSDNNSFGTGDNVTDYIEFNPWIGKNVIDGGIDDDVDGDNGNVIDRDHESEDQSIRLLLILILLLVLGMISILVISVYR